MIKVLSKIRVVEQSLYKDLITAYCVSESLLHILFLIAYVTSEAIRYAKPLGTLLELDALCPINTDQLL